MLLVKLIEPMCIK